MASLACHLALNCRVRRACLQASDLKLSIRGSATVKPEVVEVDDGTLLVTYVRSRQSSDCLPNASIFALPAALVMVLFDIVLVGSTKQPLGSTNRTWVQQIALVMYLT